MKQKPGRAGIAAAVGLAVFAFAMTYDLGVVRPHQERYRDLLRRRAEAQRDLSSQVQRRQDCRRLAALLGVDDLTEVMVPPQEDPVGYLGRLLRRSGLKTLTLGVSGQKQFSELHRTELLVRAAGDYPALVRFVRALEQGRRLARIEDFEIAATLDSRDLEGRFQVALYDPIARTETP